MNASTSKGGSALIALATAQFLMVLDQSVMNVSISQLVADFHTTVTTIQAVITLYCLVMAMLILTGAKIGDIIGRRRAFVIGLVIYACGSALTAASQSVAALALGWSILEGIGAALVFPALAALIAGNFEGTRRKAAYAVIGGVAGAGIAVGPIVGGWATTNLSWRIVFVGEVFIAAFILIMTRKVADAPGPTPKPKLDIVGSVLSATGLGVFVYGVLQSSTWGWLQPKNSPVTIFGFSLTIYVIAAGCVLLWGFVTWQRHREATGHDPLIHLSLARIPPVRSGVIGLFSQNLILMGTFFVVPLYLQLVLGLNALDTGIKMLPISITMFLTAARRRQALEPVPGAQHRPHRTGRHHRRGAHPAGDDPAHALRRRLRHRHGRPRRRDGPDDLPARQRHPILGRRIGAKRSRRTAVHRPTTRLRPRRRVHRRHRAHRTDQHLHLHRRTGHAHQRRSVHPSRCGRRLQHQLRLLEPSRDRRPTRRPRPRHHRRAGRRLRDRPAPIPQSRPPRRGAPGPHLPRLHPRATPRRTRAPKLARPCRRVELNPWVIQRCLRPRPPERSGPRPGYCSESRDCQEQRSVEDDLRPFVRRTDAPTLSSALAEAAHRWVHRWCGLSSDGTYPSRRWRAALVRPVGGGERRRPEDVVRLLAGGLGAAATVLADGADSEPRRRA